MAKAIETPPAKSSAHTAGPWTLEESDDMDLTLELRADSGSKHLAYIATMSEASEDDFDTAEECEADCAEMDANARLIAAAPDLLKIAIVAATQFSERIEGLREELSGDPDCDGDTNELIGCYESLLRWHNRVIAQATETAA